MIRRRAAAPLLVAIAATALLAAPAGSAAATTSVTCPAAPRPIDSAQEQRVWRIAADRLAERAGPRTYPFGATGPGPYTRTSAYAWTSGFYPASLWLMYERTQERIWRERARSYTTRLLPVAGWTGSHDLGFMIGTPAMLGLRLDPSAARGLTYATAIREASRSLSARWNSRVGAIRSSFYDGRWGLIIDSAMNAPMLIETGLIDGGGEGRRLAARGTEHLRTLVRYFVRADGSTRHRLAFNPRTGAPTGPLYGQGLTADSTWSRGQAWAINGFARGHRLTGDPQLLDAARRTADLWISRVPAGCIPAWDLDVTSDSSPRDSSAAAITADGLLTLSSVEPDTARAAAYRDYALTTLGTLAAPTWVPDRGRGLLARQSYNVPADPREGTYAWGDTYLLSALAKVASTRQSSG